MFGLVGERARLLGVGRVGFDLELEDEPCETEAVIRTLSGDTVGVDLEARVGKPCARGEPTGICGSAGTSGTSSAGGAVSAGSASGAGGASWDSLRDVCPARSAGDAADLGAVGFRSGRRVKSERLDNDDGLLVHAHCSGDETRAVGTASGSSAPLA